jgi:uncharacterized membrane protein
VELVLLITVVGGLLLFLSDRQLASRIALLEREVGSLRAAQSEPAGSAHDLPAPGQSAQPAEPQAGRDVLSTWFERVVAGRLLIWTGGIALAAGGIFLIRHSIELIGPAARMVAAALLGVLLIGAGEGARRGRLLSGDPRIAQALVGAGITVLLATAYGSHILFGLIAGATAAILLVLITGAALVLSLRHGAPTAALGLIGGFSAPLLVGQPEAGALPVLLYVTLLDAAIVLVAARRGWRWLVAAAIAASFAWTGSFILRESADALAAGVFAGLFGIAGSLVRSAPGSRSLLAPAAVVALFELAILVGRGDLGTPAWLLFGAVAGVSVSAAAVRAEQRLLPGAALLIALALIAWQAAFAQDPLLPWAAAAVTMLFSLGMLPALASGGGLAALTACGALAGPLLILRLLRPDLLSPTGYGSLALLLAIAALALLWAVRNKSPDYRKSRAAEFVAAGTATLLGAIGARNIVSPDLLSGAWLLLSIALLLAGVRLGDKALRVAGLALLTVTVCKVFVIDAAELEGVLRILSFLGLGVALIGIGLLYGKVLGRAPAPAGKP